MLQVPGVRTRERLASIVWVLHDSLKSVKPEYPPRINDFQDELKGLTSIAECKGSFSNGTFQVLGEPVRRVWALNETSR